MPFSRIKRTSLGLDMSPLIDCVFLLLVFFMLSLSFGSQAIPLSLPRAASRTSAPEGLAISADAEGRVFLGHEQVPLEALAGRLREALGSSPGRPVTFRGDERTPYRAFVAVLDAARSAGVKDFRIAHAPPKEPARR